MRNKLGLIINPVAGIGGRVGLKGSDGEAIRKRAFELGAVPVAENRAYQSLKSLNSISDQMDMVTCPGEMGETAARYSGFEPKVIGSIQEGSTTPEDTCRAAIEMEAYGVRLLLFAGGDGTARDIYRAIGNRLTVLGIPAGVKIHSGVFARNPMLAGELAKYFLLGRSIGTREVEVMDVDEEAYRCGVLKARLYGYLKIPYERRMLQGLKSGSAPREELSQNGIAMHVVEQMQDNILYILGPGTTNRAIARLLGLSKTLLGVDVINKRNIMVEDVNEKKLIKVVKGTDSRIIITPIGGQGFLFGRGNQQISPEVIKKVGLKNLIVVSTIEKLNALQGRPLLVDTGDLELDQDLSGYTKVITGYREAVIYKVSS